MRVSLLAALVVLALSLSWHWGWSWFSVGRFEETTDNAYVQADITSVASKVSGYVIAVEVNDNERVSAGDVLFRIDEKDYRARLAQADANIASARAALLNVDAETRLQGAVIAQEEAKLQSVRAAHVLAQQTYDRYGALVSSRTVSEAKYDESKAAVAATAAAVSAARKGIEAQHGKLDVLAAHREAALAALSQVEAARELAKIDLENATVRAPVAGVIGNRQVRIGRYLAPGAPVIDIVPVQDVWVIANFKETQLELFRVGQTARVAVDGYPDVEVLGVVDSLAPGSGAAFSLIPPDNATGNFVRVVQRVPVKIRLTAVPAGTRLVPGLSARVSVRTAVGEAS